MGRFRLFSWLVFALVLLALALVCQAYWPGHVLTVTVYKAHLLALGGFGGYWLDRALFPYARPDNLVDEAVLFNAATLRRAIVVAACLICVGLGA